MFDDQFEVLLADNEPARSLHYQIRYQVYCLETGYENPKQFPEGEERDRWDERAAHFLVRHRHNGACVAAMRIILPATNNLPMLQLTDSATRGRLSVSLHSAAEISRICVIGQYRRRGLEPLYPHEVVINGAGRHESRRNSIVMNDTSHQRERRSEPKIMAGLLRAGTAYCMRNGISDCYFLTTRALTRVLRQMGITATLAGQACTHRGERHPYLIKTPDLAKQIATSPIFQRLFRTDQPAYRPFSKLQPARSIQARPIQARPIRSQPLLLRTASG